MVDSGADHRRNPRVLKQGAKTLEILQWNVAVFELVVWFKPTYREKPQARRLREVIASREVLEMCHINDAV